MQHIQIPEGFIDCHGNITAFDFTKLMKDSKTDSASAASIKNINVRRFALFMIFNIFFALY